MQQNANSAGKRRDRVTIFFFSVFLKPCLAPASSDESYSPRAAPGKTRNQEKIEEQVFVVPHAKKLKALQQKPNRPRSA